MPHVYGWEHLTYLAVFFIAAGVSLTLIKLKVKRQETADIIIKISGGALFALILWNRISIAVFKGDYKLILPDSFCGLSSLCLSLCALFLKRDSLPLHCFCYLSFWGGAIVTFYPDFLGQAQSFLFPATISGLLHHGAALYLSVLMFLTGYFKPCLKKFYAFPVGLSFMTVYGMFLIDALHFKKAMYIGAPLIEGTVLTWYFIALLLISATLLLVFLYEKFLKRKPAAEENGN